MSNLKRIRKLRNLTQGQLSYRSDVKLRTIKSYEQGYRDINKANGKTLKQLASILNCNIEDLLE